MVDLALVNAACLDGVIPSTWLFYVCIMFAARSTPSSVSSSLRGHEPDITRSRSVNLWELRQWPRNCSRPTWLWNPKRNTERHQRTGELWWANVPGGQKSRKQRLVVAYGRVHLKWLGILGARGPWLNHKSLHKNDAHLFQLDGNARSNLLQHWRLDYKF